MTEKLNGKRKWIDEHFEANILASRYVIDEIDIGDVTFSSGRNEGIHRWYRLTPSFSPEFVRHMFSELKVSKNDLVLDPFSGRGTTCIECQKLGIPAIGFEINPTLQTVGEYSLHWSKEFLGFLPKYLNQLAKEIASSSSLSIEEVEQKYSLTIPDIHDVYRWWKKDVLKELLIARSLIYKPEFAPVHKLLWVVMTSVSLEDCANIHRNHPTITFDDTHKKEINVFSAIESAIEKITSDLSSLKDNEINNSGACSIVRQNSCEPFTALTDKAEKATVVITSPPYPNRFSYVHQTRPQLHFMEMIDERREATEIDLNTIGGTWGRATSNLQKELITPPEHILNALCYFDELAPKSLLMCNYATKYFIDMDRHIKQLKQTISSDFRGAYFVGNSRLSGVEIFTEVILARLFEINGFDVDKIHIYRKRGGRSKLYESAVLVRI